jgi:TonB family protein
MRNYTHIAIIVGMGLHLAAMAILASLALPIGDGRRLPTPIDLVVDFPSMEVPAEATATTVRLEQDAPFSEFNRASELTSSHARVMKSAGDAVALRRRVDSEQAPRIARRDKLDLRSSRNVDIARGSRRHLERLIDRSPKLVARTPLVANFVPTLTTIRRPAIEIIYSRVRKPKPLEVAVLVTDEQDEYDRLAKPLPGNPLPRYPAGIYFRGRGGVCEIEVLVSNFGHVTRLRLIRSSGNEWLDRSGMSAVSQWRFTPAIQNGKAQASLVNVSVAFSVNTN